MRALDTVIRGADHVLNIFVCILLLLALFLGGYALFDAWQVYHGAALDDGIFSYQPTLGDNHANFAELTAINPDICAWISIDATRINYPVVQGQDNAEYLNKNFYGEYAVSGTVFLDRRNSNDFSDRYSIIYGHHMEGGMMFGDMDLFADETFFKEHVTGWLYLPDKTYQLTIFAYTPASAFGGVAYVLPGSDGQVEELIAYLRQNSTWFREPEAYDHLIALSTCAAAETSGRTLLIAQMTEYTDEGNNAQG